MVAHKEIRWGGGGGSASTRNASRKDRTPPPHGNGPLHHNYENVAKDPHIMEKNKEKKVANRLPILSKKFEDFPGGEGSAYSSLPEGGGRQNPAKD